MRVFKDLQRHKFISEISLKKEFDKLKSKNSKYENVEFCDYVNDCLNKYKTIEEVNKTS